MDSSGCFAGATPRGHPPKGSHCGVRERVAPDERVTRREGVVDHDGPGPGHGRERTFFCDNPGADDPRGSHDAAGAPGEEDVVDVHASSEWLSPAVRGRQQQQMRRSGRDGHSVLSCNFDILSRRIRISIDECQNLKNRKI